VGCGLVNLAKLLKKEGFAVSGIETAEHAVQVAQSAGIEVEPVLLDDYVKKAERTGAKPFDAIVLMSVLEHVPRPWQMLSLAGQILAPGGVVYLRVPNDFNAFQVAAHNAKGIRQWWIGIPDHINYFDFPSLEGLLDKVGFQCVHSTTDFPMEFFLLAGDDYVRDSDLGYECHKKRMSFELSLPPEVRRGFYDALASASLGRSVIMIARRKI